MAQTFQWVAVGAVVVALAAWGGRRLAKWGMRKFYRWYFTRTIEPAHKPVVSRNALPDASLLGRGRAIVQNLQEIYPEHSFRPWKAVRPTSVKSPGELDSLLRAASDEEVNTSSMEVSGGGTIRIVELNMEMGRHFDAVLRNLVELQPDIVVLTEVSVGSACLFRCDSLTKSAYQLLLFWKRNLQLPQKIQSYFAHCGLCENIWCLLRMSCACGTFRLMCVFPDLAALTRPPSSR